MTRFILDLSASRGQAFTLATRLQQALVPSALRKTTILAGLADLEISLKRLEGVLEEAMRLPNATAESVTDAAIAASSAIELATGDISCNGSLGGLDGSAPSSGQLATQLALAHPAFLALATLVPPLEATTGEERCAILVAAAASKCVIALRVLIAGTMSLARLHPVLGKILDSRSELHTYFGLALTMDRAPPYMVPERLTGFTWTGERGDEVLTMGLFLEFAFRKMDFFNGAVGYNAVRARLIGVNQPRSYTDPLDFYTMTRSVASVCEILHRLWCSIGAPDSVPLAVGFTALTWRDFYTIHIERAYELSTLAEQIMWLDLAANYFCQFLSVAETQFKQYIYSTQPQSATLVTVAPFDCPPAVAMRRQQTDLDSINRNADRRWWCSNPVIPGVPPQTGELPKLSDYPSQVSHYVPPPSSDAPPAGLKRPRAADPQAANPAAPGSLCHLWMWITKGETLLMVGSVWDVKSILADLKSKLPAQGRGLCWAMLLSMRTGANLRALYPANNAGADAHKSIAVIQPKDPEFARKYRRTATEAEKAVLAKKAPNFRQSA